MWWTYVGGGSSWLSLVLSVAVGFGGLALLIAIALREEYAPRWRRPGPKHAVGSHSSRGESGSHEYLERVDALEVRHG